MGRAGGLNVTINGLGISFSPSPHSPLIGWALLFLAALIPILTVDRWAKVLPAILAWGIIGGILTIVEGHAVNHPEVRVSRPVATVMTLLIGGSAILSLTFKNRKLASLIE
jgi:hypothetical protein